MNKNKMFQGVNKNILRQINKTLPDAEVMVLGM